jgi:hypothetical protein
MKLLLCAPHQLGGLLFRLSVQHIRPARNATNLAYRKFPPLLYASLVTVYVFISEDSWRLRIATQRLPLSATGRQLCARTGRPSVVEWTATGYAAQTSASDAANGRDEDHSQQFWKTLLQLHISAQNGGTDQLRRISTVRRSICPHA